MVKNEHSFLSIPLKPQIFIPPKLGGMGGNGLIIFLLKLPKCPYIFNLLF